MADLLDEDSLGAKNQSDYTKEGLFTHRKSLKVINNLAEFILRYEEKSKNVNPLFDNLKINQISNMWMVCGSKLNEVATPIDFARNLSLLAILNSEQENVKFYIKITIYQKKYITSEGLFNAAEQLLADKICYERVEQNKFYSIMLENFDNRNSEAEKAMKLASDLADNLTYWSPKLINVMTLDVDY